jgi:hypothetical protein
VEVRMKVNGNHAVLIMSDGSERVGPRLPR